MNNDPFQHDVLNRLYQIELKLDMLVQHRTVKDWYSTADVAQLLRKSEYTVREWCRHRRLNAEKQFSGRGPHSSWVISHEELQRYHREGLLPLGPTDDEEPTY